MAADQEIVHRPHPALLLLEGRAILEVESSHLGMGHHPVVLLTIADRLAQPEGAWRPFTPPPGWRWPRAPRTRSR